MPEFFATFEPSPRFRELFEFSNRISKLLADPAIQGRAALEACLDDLLGAVYGMILSVHNKYDDRPQPLAPRDVQSVAQRANDMAGGKVRTNGKWTAGFYFNSALFRIAATYHRALKVLAGKEQDRNIEIKQLLELVKPNFKKSTGRDWDDGRLKKLKDEVNNLKHDSKGIFHGRDISYDHATGALDDLLTLIETLK